MIHEEKNLILLNSHFISEIRKLAFKSHYLCDPVDYSLPGFSVHGIFLAIVLEWMTIPSPGNLPNPGIELRSPSL